MALWVFTQKDLGKFSQGNMGGPTKMLTKASANQER